MFFLTKLKGNIKDIPSSFCLESKELPRIKKASQETQNCFPMYFFKTSGSPASFLSLKAIIIKANSEL